MTFCHSALLDEALDAVALRESIVILGRPLSGRSTVLQAIAQHLREAGHDPLVVRGVRGLDPALSSLGLAQVVGPPAKGHDTTVSAVFASLTDRLAPHDQTLLIDDLDDLDDSSAALLQHAAARTGAAVVATGRASGRVGDRVPFPAALRLDMHPLTFEECAELLSDVLGGVVESATVARLMTKTAGLPGLMVRFASAARRSGRLVERGGVWQAGPDLWSPGISRVMSTFVAGLSAELSTALLRLARAGVIGLAGARSLVGDRALLALEELRLIAVPGPVEAGGEPSVAISPPLLAQYLRRETSPLVRALSAVVDERRAERPAADPDGPDGSPSIPALAVLVQERGRAKQATRYARWGSERGPVAATALIEVLIGRGVDRREILRVIERTDPAGVPEDDLLRYVDTIARWHAWVDDDLPGALDLLHATAHDTGSERARAAALGLARHLGSVAARPDSGHGTGAGAVGVGVGVAGTPSAVLDAVNAGDGSRARRLLAGIPEPEGGQELMVHRALDLRAAALCDGDLDVLVDRATGYREESMAALDPFGVAVHSQLAATGLFLQGRHTEAESVLDEALTIGVPPFPEMPVQVGNLTMLAALQARRGRFDLAESTQRQAERFGVVHSYLPLGSTAWSRAYIDALRDGDEALDALWESGRELERRGFLPAALAVWTMAIAPWSADRLAHLRSVAADVPGDLFAPMIRYHEGLATQDPGRLLVAFDALRAQRRPFFAGVIARALAVVHRLDESRAELWRTRAHDLADQVGCAPLDLTPGRSLRAAITPREQDILRLVVAGRTNAEIATSCFLSVRTVENHVHRIIRKLGVPSRAELGEVWK